MEFTAQFDVDVVALAAGGDPHLPDLADRSGSMYGGPIERAHGCGWRSGSRVDPTYSAP